MIMVFATAMQHVNSIKPQLERIMIMIARRRIVVRCLFLICIWFLRTYAVNGHGGASYNLIQ